MKLLIAFFSLLLVHASPAYLLVDKDLKKPVVHAEEFTTEQYLQRNFPVYAADVNAITDATDLAVRAIDKYAACKTLNTIVAAHTTFLIEKECEGSGRISVTLITEIENNHTSYSFALVRDESDIRKVQRKLLDFATYINP